MSPLKPHCVSCTAVAVMCYYLLATSLLPQPARASESSTAAADPSATCSNSLNLGLDYFLKTQLFENLTKIDLPVEIPLTVKAFKIVNLRLTGLNEVSRGCSLKLSQAGDSRLQMSACAHAARLGVSFMVRAGFMPLDFVQASIKDTGVSARAIAHMVPGGRITLENLDITLGRIEVETTGFIGSIFTRVMQMSSVRKKLQQVISSEASKRIQAVLDRNPLPK